MYSTDGGVTRKIKKLYANVGGVNREIKQLWAKQDGVNMKIFNSGVSATVEVISSTGGATCLLDDDGGGLLRIPAVTDDSAITIWYRLDEPIDRPADLTMNYALTAEVRASELAMCDSSGGAYYADGTSNDFDCFTPGEHKVTLSKSSGFSFAILRIMISGPQFTGPALPDIVLSWEPSSIKIIGWPLNDVHS